MKSITEVLGSVQMLFDLDFDLQDAFEAYLTSEQKVFLSMLRQAASGCDGYRNPGDGSGHCGQCA
jgi:hypothetical protein